MADQWWGENVIESSDASISIVKNQIKTVTDYADQAYQNVRTYMSDVTTDVVKDPLFIKTSDIKYSWTEPELKSPPWLSGNRPTVPKQNDLIPDPVTSPDFPTLQAITLNPDTLPKIPVFHGQMPEIDLPDAPGTALPKAPGDAPVVRDVDDVMAPVVTLPSIPRLTDFSIPSSPDLNTPSMDVVFPVNTLSPPNLIFSYYEETYQSTLLDAVKAKILSDVQTGGTGLGEAIETAIWNRAKARTELENARIYEQATEFWSARGWRIPPGPLTSAITEAIVEQTRANSDINEKIAIEQARLAQANTQFSVTQAVQLTSELIRHTDSVATRAFEAERSRIQTFIDDYKLEAENYAMKLDAYKSSAVVFETKLRVATLQLEQWKGLIEGARLSADVQAQKLQLYNAQLAGIQASVELYKTQRQAALAQLEVDRARLDAHKETVSVYMARLQAKTSEYNLYQAKIAGQAEKAKLYSDEVRAYATSVEAVQTYIAALKTKLEAKSIENDHKIKAYALRVDEYKAKLAANQEEVDLKVKAYGIAQDVYSEDVRAAIADLNSQLEQYKAGVEKSKGEVEILLKRAEINARIYEQNRQLAFEASRAGTNVYAQLAASALSAVHVGANFGFSANESLGGSFTEHKTT